MSTVAGGIKELVKKTVAENKIAVFSKTYCSFSIRAKDLLDDMQVEYKVVELNVEPEGEAIQRSLAELTKQNTVPNIFINQQHLGGYSDLQAAYSSGKLQKLLKVGTKTENF
ncbi:glutaredoxin [Sporodiniella umbellata]|nr:glutaredoxin [Sporodiniella umbellata]